MIASEASTLLRSPGARIKIRGIGRSSQDIRASQKYLTDEVPIKDRRKPTGEVRWHLEYLNGIPDDKTDKGALHKQRVVKAEKHRRKDVFAIVAAKASKQLGIPITERQVRRWYETLLPPRRGPS